MTIYRPPMPYSGGKQRIASAIANLLPPHDGYIEPFAGALSVLLAKPPSDLEVVNDLDGDIVTFWRVLRDRPADLERVCALTPHARLEARLARDRSDVDDLERARRVWVLLTQHRAAVLRATSGWRFVHSGNRMPLSAYLDAYVARIAPAAERLKRVSLECRPALDIISAYGNRPENLLYVDPPYLGETRTSRRGQYRHEMLTEDSHIELLEHLLEAKAAVALSGYTHPLYDEALIGWDRHELDAVAAMGQARTEVVWIKPAGRSSASKVRRAQDALDFEDGAA